VSTCFFSFVTNHGFDRRTGRLTDSFLMARPRCMQCMQCMQRGKKLKTETQIKYSGYRICME